MKTVSVIIPVRNMAGPLDRALASVFSQTYRPYEVIVADDLSSDGAGSVCAKYGLGVLYNPGFEPWGSCGGRNEALRVSHGEFILPLDADDWIAPTYVEKTLAKMTAGVGIVSTWMQYHGENEDMVSRGEQTYDSELRVNNIPITSLVRREALEQVGLWDNSLRGWEDWDMWLRILKIGWQHAVVNEPLFHYTLSGNGQNAWAAEPENRLRLFERMSGKHPDFKDARKNGDRFNGI